MPQEIQNIEQLIEDSVRITNERDYSMIPDVIAESFVGHAPSGADDIHGQEGLEEWLREFLAAFPDVEFVVEDKLIDDGLVMEEWTLTGTHEGEYNGLPPTHNEIELEGMSKFVVEDGKIAEEFMYYNLQEFFDQLGVSDE